MNIARIAPSLILALCTFQTVAQIPSVYSNLKMSDGSLFANIKGQSIKESNNGRGYTLNDLIGNPKGTELGMQFNFGPKVKYGTVYFGLINPMDGTFPMPVYFKRTAKINNSIAEVNLQQLTGKYDMSGWEKGNLGQIGYRVVNSQGMLLYDGRLNFSFQNELFRVMPSIIQGPFVNQLTDSSVVISATLNRPTKLTLTINDENYVSEKTAKIEFKVNELASNTEYKYQLIEAGNRSYSFKTAPKIGAKDEFVFAYASDSRNGQGGGERNLYGANYYVMQRVVAYSKARNAAFLQFTGDMINGYLADKLEMNLQYANWKRSLEPFASNFPVNVAMGNHEALVHYFSPEGSAGGLGIDRFPFESESAEAVFASNFCNYSSELTSEDGSIYDPDPNTTDFPPYSETVYSYVHGNVAVIVLNSNYWYAYSLTRYPSTSGNIHAYIMDNQLDWFKKELVKYEEDNAIEHVFVTLHTPFFPNGGHVSDDMWYNGKNWPRPIIAGERVEKGIIERRDELLDAMINQTTKVRALLTGDEHNYAKTKICEEMPRYPEGWNKPKLKLKRSIYQINNGSAGAPYYAQEETPWSDYVSNFSTQNVVVLVKVGGEKVSVQVKNPFTEETVDEFQLTK